MTSYSDRLETGDPALYLRRTQPDEGPELFNFVTAADNYPHLCTFEQWPVGFTREQAEAQVAGVCRRMTGPGDEIMQYRLRAGEDDRMVGCVTLFNHVGHSAVLGYYVAAAACGNNYATMGARRILDYAAQEWSLEEVVCRISPHNTPSLRVAAKLGASGGELAILQTDSGLVKKQIWKIPMHGGGGWT